MRTERCENGKCSRITANYYRVGPHYYCNEECYKISIGCLPRETIRERIRKNLAEEHCGTISHNGNYFPNVVPR